jgi:ABC-type transporter Mla maintaining outer membrane lipid asymmetry permease subunit MlaE
MHPVGRVVVALLAACVIAFALLFAFSHATGCPSGQVSVLGADSWYCVTGTKME